MARTQVVAVSILFVLTAAWAVAQAQDTQRQRLGGAQASDRISREVRHEILMLPYYTVFDMIGYQVQGNNVTLTGQVTRPSLKNDAENAVKRIEGVDNVTNNIQVLPTSPMDDRIRWAEYRAIYGFPTLNKYGWGVNQPIHIIVNNGRVTLVGQVDSQADKDAANIQANSVPGVFGVTNDLQVGGGGTH